MAKQILNDVNVETINIGNIFPSNQYGEFEIVDKYNNINNGGRIRFTIRFIKTGTEKTNISPQQIREGTIRDEYYPIHYGVACMGKLKKREYPNGPIRREYMVWHGIIRRCYNPEDKDYKTYGALGVKVCDRWLCFENFYNDLPNIPGYNEWLNNRGDYHLDKDYLQRDIPHSQKIYSPTTCMFMSKYNNSFQRAMDHSNTGYVGVNQITDNSYNAFIHTLESGFVNLGTYNSLEAAINARNRGNIKYFGNDTFLNNVNYMNFNEICNCYIGKNLEKTKDNLSIEMCKIELKEMCKIVKDKNNNTH